jgi:hypothetical protein
MTNIDNKPLFLSHKSNKDKKYKLNTAALSKSSTLMQIYNNMSKFALEQKIIYITEGNESTLIFIVKYLNFYAEIIEIPAPDYPMLEDVKLKDLFDDIEHNIFDDLLQLDSQYEKNLMFMKNLLKIAEALNMEILLKKITTIIAYYMIHKLQ